MPPTDYREIYSLIVTRPKENYGKPDADPDPRFPRALLAGRSLEPSAEGHKGARVLVQAGWLYATLGDEELVALAPARGPQEPRP